MKNIIKGNTENCADRDVIFYHTILDPLPLDGLDVFFVYPL